MWIRLHGSWSCPVRVLQLYINKAYETRVMSFSKTHCSHIKKAGFNVHVITLLTRAFCDGKLLLPTLLVQGNSLPSL